MTRPLSLQDILGVLKENTDEWAHSYELTKDDFDWIVDELDLIVEEEEGVRYTYDPDDETLVGEFVESEDVYYTDLDLDEYAEDDLDESNLKKDGTLDFRRLLGRATKKYQNTLIAGACFSSPVSGDAGEPNIPAEVSTQIDERIVKRVNSKGKISRGLDKRTRRRRATQTTGMSPAKRKQIARRAARTKKRNPMIGKRALRKRKKALRKRKALGLR